MNLKIEALKSLNLTVMKREDNEICIFLDCVAFLLDRSAVQSFYREKRLKRAQKVYYDFSSSEPMKLPLL